MQLLMMILMLLSITAIVIAWKRKDYERMIASSFALICFSIGMIVFSLT